MDRLIQVEDVSMIYNRHRPDEMQALANVSLEVKRGEVVALRGPSGSGKTSLLSLIGCMGRPTSGRILVGGREVSRLPERFLAGIRRETFGFVFQQFNLLRDLNVRDNILLPLYPTAVPTREMNQRAEEILAHFELGARQHAKIRQMSGGEQQRVAIARALINRPQIIIADEPTAHLDSRLSEELLNILAGLKRAGMTLIIATHDPEVFRHELIDRTYLLEHGSLVEAQTS